MVSGGGWRRVFQFDIHIFPSKFPSCLADLSVDVGIMHASYYIRLFCNTGIINDEQSLNHSLPRLLSCNAFQGGFVNFGSIASLDALTLLFSTRLPPLFSPLSCPFPDSISASSCRDSNCLVDLGEMSRSLCRLASVDPQSTTFFGIGSCYRPRPHWSHFRATDRE